MDPLTELLTGLGRHYGLVLVGCAELIAALFLLGWRPRERFTAVSPVDRLMLSELLLSLINDILDMSRIEAGKVELEAAPFSLRAFGSKLCDMFSKPLDAKDVRCDVRFDGMTADWVVGGELRIGQVVINFLSNAVKFTSQGEVTVTFRQMLLREGTLDLMLRVHGTGIGMDPEFINRIFRPFEQEDASATRRFGGTGLGMAISDQLVRLMGGQIVVESMKGQGSDFSVILSLPVADEAQAAQAEAAPAPQKLSCRVLMAEDNEINAMITVEILGQKGVTLDVAENGQAAVERFSSQPPGTYATILMDVQMPVMDGRAAARAIRALIAGLTAAAAAAGTAYIIQVYQSGQGFHPFQSDRELRNDQILFPGSDSASGFREDGDASDDSFWQEDGADDGATPEGAQSAYLFGQDQPAPEGVPSGSVSIPAAPGDAQMNGTLPSGGNVYEITEDPEPGSTDLALPGNLNGGTASGEGTGGGEEVLPGGLHPGTGGSGAERPALVSDHGPGPGTGLPLDGFPAQAGGQRPAVAGDHRPRSDDGDPPDRALRSGLCGIFGPVDAGPAQSAPAPERAAVEHHPGGPAAEHLSPPRRGNGKRHRLPRRCGRADPRPPLRQGAAAGGASGPGRSPQRGQRRGPAHPRRSGKGPLSSGLCGRGL